LLLLVVMLLGTVSVKVDEGLKRRMRSVRVNWSEYIREAIRRRVDLEARKSAAEKLLEDLKARKHVAPKGFIDETIKELRENR